LVYLGILKYSDELLNRLRSDPHLASGSELEVEIRACSIWAVELLRREMEQQCQTSETLDIDAPLNAITIDFYLWTFAKEHQQEMADIPIHKTRSVFY
jgi:hypothetical protein